MKKLIRLLTVKTAVILIMLTIFTAQDTKAFVQTAPFEINQSDTQLFAFDNKNNIFAGINNTENSIVIVNQDESGGLFISNRFIVDKIADRKDKQNIYRSKYVAIIDEYIAFIASNQDSCYFAILNLNGELEKKLMFPINAGNFNYNQEKNELYIIGENETGFVVFVLDTNDGINNIDIKNTSMFLHQKLSDKEEINQKNESNIGSKPVIVLGIIFIVLILFYLIFKYINDKSNHVKKTDIPIQENIVIADVVNEEVFAAISAAIYLYSEELTDIEKTVLTINKISRSYSPWSMKIQGLNTYFK